MDGNCGSKDFKMLQSFQPTEYLNYFLRIVVGFTFLFSAIAKLGGIEEYIDAVRKFELVPSKLVVASAFIFLLSELLAFVLLIFFSSLSWAGFAICIILLSIFSIALFSSLSKGVEFSCNCFGQSDQPISRRHIYRNLFLLTMCIIGCLSSKSYEQADILTVILFLFPGFIVSFVISQWDTATYVLSGMKD